MFALVTGVQTCALPSLSHSPIDGKVIGQLASARREEVEAAIGRAHDDFLAWRTVPAPRRGELVRLSGQVLREGKEPLARLVSLAKGKDRTSVDEQRSGSVRVQLDGRSILQ